jgi:membrane protein YqaA with SNARE-associated domain
MLRKLYDWVLRQAASRHATTSLAVVSFAESSFFPIPPDVMLAPMVYARPERAYWYAFVCTAASVIGGVAGYMIGMFLEPVGMAILSLFGHAEGLEEFQAWYDKWGVWVILAKGLTPIPYKLVTIASGLAAFNFGVFIAASVVTRGARFFIVAALVKRFGPAIQPVIERRLTLFTVLLVAAIVLGVLAIKFLF